METAELVKLLKGQAKTKLDTLTAYPEFTSEYIDGFDQGVKFILKSLKKISIN